MDFVKKGLSKLKKGSVELAEIGSVDMNSIEEKEIPFYDNDINFKNVDKITLENI